MRAGTMERPTRPLTEAERIFWESPHGPNWAARLQRALRAEYGCDPEWVGPYEKQPLNQFGERETWWVRREP
jgi:hypothetical protein